MCISSLNKPTEINNHTQSLEIFAGLAAISEELQTAVWRILGANIQIFYF